MVITRPPFGKGGMKSLNSLLMLIKQLLKLSGYFQRGLNAYSYNFSEGLIIFVKEIEFYPMPQASLIISVYKKKSELELIFGALKRQTFTDFEVIVADDDSQNEMASHVVESAAKHFLDVKFITHTFTGFGKNRILNKAILASQTDYLVFIDGDCIPHRGFIEGHLSAGSSNRVLCGRRVMLGEEVSARLKDTGSGFTSDDLSFTGLLWDKLKGKNHTTYVEEALYIKSSWLRNLRGRDISLTGCNFSLPRALMMKINGFDEDYTGPGIGEDSDLEHRLRAAQAEVRSVRNLAILYHVYHPLTVESNTNYDHFHGVVQSREGYYCKNGLVKSH